MKSRNIPAVSKPLPFAIPPHDRTNEGVGDICYRQRFIAASPPCAGRYVVWRKDRPNWDWDAAIMTADGRWLYTDAWGPMDDVERFMDVGGERFVRGCADREELGDVEF